MLQPLLKLFYSFSINIECCFSIFHAFIFSFQTELFVTWLLHADTKTKVLIRVACGNVTDKRVSIIKKYKSNNEDQQLYSNVVNLVFIYITKHSHDRWYFRRTRYVLDGWIEHATNLMGQKTSARCITAVKTAKHFATMFARCLKDRFFANLNSL